MHRPLSGRSESISNDSTVPYLSPYCIHILIYTGCCSFDWWHIALLHHVSIEYYCNYITVQIHFILYISLPTFMVTYCNLNHSLWQRNITVREKKTKYNMEKKHTSVFDELKIDIKMFSCHGVIFSISEWLVRWKSDILGRLCVSRNIVMRNEIIIIVRLKNLTFVKFIQVTQYYSM